ncbi:MAG: biotin--[acetyl-CoA-carboxylase] ligase [Lentisphaeraceae bacterium]|nr:biotin--[acetyl-CoA-carboxylase] ligase [Lentisphaeraceae bacterium]
MKFNILSFDEIDSTNQYLLENAPTLENYTVVTANKQTQGRGRKGRVWESSSNDNLYFSLLIKSIDISFEELSSIPQIMGLAVCESLQKCGISKSWIKWPNDVFVDDQKICGVLCETRLKGMTLEGLIIGVGLNVNLPEAELKKIDKPATSMLVESNDKKPFSTKETLHVVLQAFDKYFKIWQQKERRSELVEHWRQNSRLIGKAVTLSDDQKTIYGTVVDFSENGEVILQNENGLKSYSYGDLSLRLQ